MKQEHKWMEVVILTGHGAVDSAVECTKSGAYYSKNHANLISFLEFCRMHIKESDEQKEN